MTIYFIDNFDSFTFNLIHYIASIDENINIIIAKNNKIVSQIINQCDGIVISPGPGLPNEAGGLMQVIADYYLKKPILGVCLGHQALGQFFGATLYNLEKPKHGIASEIKIDADAVLYRNLISKIKVGHYHSWAIKDLPSCLKITGKDADNVVMSFEHTILPVFGVQYHPESILTPSGKHIISNFINALK